MTAKLILRDKEYEVRPGMTLLDALKKSNIVPESVIATREGEMITEDEVLRYGDVVKLISVISGGSRDSSSLRRLSFDGKIMKCRKCENKASVHMRQHKLALCKEHYLEWVPEQTARFIKKYEMFTP